MSDDNTLCPICGNYSIRYDGICYQCDTLNTYLDFDDPDISDLQLKDLKKTFNGK